MATFESLKPATKAPNMMKNDLNLALPEINQTHQSHSSETNAPVIK